MLTPLHLVEEELLHPALVLFSRTLTEQLLAFSRVSQALVVVVDVQDDLVLEIYYLVLVVAEFNSLLPLLLQLYPLLGLKIIYRLGDALDIIRITLTN